jgi:NRPS condensation-like uncharacterized protein
VRKQRVAKFLEAFGSVRKLRAEGEFAVREWSGLWEDISRLEMRCLEVEKRIMIDAFDEVRTSGFLASKPECSHRRDLR